MKRILNKKIKGYAITLEVIFTLAIMTLFINSTLYILNGLNIQRYMNTVLTSTVIQTAKWGGTNSNAYIANGMNYSIVQNAQNELNKLPSKFRPVIEASPEKITEGDTKVRVKLSWTYPTILGLPEKRVTAVSEMEAIMRPGGLL